MIIDFVPNHVARSYASDVRPELSFGEGDDRDVFFDRDNHFYYLGPDDAGGGPPLKLPTAGHAGLRRQFGAGDRASAASRATTWFPGHLRSTIGMKR